MGIVRRSLLLTPILALLPRAAHAQEALPDVLDKLTAYFAAAATMTGATVSVVSQVRPSRFRRAERPRVAMQITEFHDALTRLSMAQGIMLGDMGDYIESVRARGFTEAEHPRMWRGVVGQLRDISSRVNTVYEAQEQATWLKVTLSAADEQALKDVLLARISLISRLVEMPAPRTPIEIDKLAALHARYQDLAKKLSELRLALTEAQRRFTS